MKKQITKSEYYSLIGLLTLARQHTQATEDITDAVMKVIGETDIWGHASDTVWSTETGAADKQADSLLKKLSIKVKE